MPKNSIYTDCGYGAIYGQLGIIGIISIVVFYLYVVRNTGSLSADRFFITSFILSIFSLLFFAGYTFGYKTFGMIHLCLGVLMGMHHSSSKSFQSVPFVNKNVRYMQMPLNNSGHVFR